MHTATAHELGNDPESDGLEINRGRALELVFVRVVNRHTADIFLNLYDARLATVTAGTDRHTDPIVIRPGAVETIPMGVKFDTAISMLASTESDGTGSSPAVPLSVHVGFASIL